MNEWSKACREGSGNKYHASVFDKYKGNAIVATKCDYSYHNNSGALRRLYAAGSYINCKRCLAAIRKEGGK